MAIEKAKGIVQRFEDCRLEAYRCPAGKWTIGWGHTGPEVHEGMTITQARADELLDIDLQIAQRCVRNSAKLRLTEGQESALISFVYNVGCRQFGRSTLLRYLNNGDDDLAGMEFKRWVYGGGKVLPGLERRRQAETDLFYA